MRFLACPVRRGLVVRIALAAVVLRPAISSAELTNVLGVVSRANAVAVGDDGKIVVAGVSYAIHEYPDYFSDLAITRYNADGTPDDTFGVHGVVITDLGSTNEEAKALVVQEDGKIVVAGNSGTYPAVVRYLPDGSIDTGFGVAGIAAPAMGLLNAVAIQDDGAIVVGGYGTGEMYGTFALARLLPDGSADASFGTGGIVEVATSLVERPVNALAIQPDQKIVAVGGTYETPAIVRFATDGSLDASFDGDGIISIPGFEGAATSVVLQGDGRIVLGGRTNDSYYSNKIMTVARYLANGSLDVSFGGDGVVQPPLYVGFDDVRVGVGIIGDGDIVISGDCDYTWIVERFHTNGALDTSFDIDGISISDLGGDGRYGRTGACALAIDGNSILTAGHWAYGWNETFAITRHAANGSLDPAFSDDGSIVESDCLRFPLDASSCRTAMTSKLAISYSPKTDRRALQWKWSAGETFAQAELGTPDVDTRYTVCIYDTSGGQPQLMTWFDVYNGFWTSKAPSGWSFYGGKYGNVDGISAARLRASPTGGRTSVSMRAAAYYDIPVPYPVSGSRYFGDGASFVVQLVGTSGFCLQSDFPAASVLLDSVEAFKASAHQ